MNSIETRSILEFLFQQLSEELERLPSWLKIYIFVRHPVQYHFSSLCKVLLPPSHGVRDPSYLRTTLHSGWWSISKCLDVAITHCKLSSRSLVSLLTIEVIGEASFTAEVDLTVKNIDETDVQIKWKLSTYLGISY